MIHNSMTSSAVDILNIPCVTLSVVRNMNSHFIKSLLIKDSLKQKLQSLMRFMFWLYQLKIFSLFSSIFFKTLNVS